MSIILNDQIIAGGGSGGGGTGDSLNYNQVTNCILEAPNGVATYSGSTITVKSGLKVLIPNGRNADGTLKNIEYTLANDVTYTYSNNYADTFYLNIYSDGSVRINSTRIRYYVNKLSEAPTPATNQWYDVYVVDENKFYNSSNGAAYTEKVYCDIGIFSVNSSNQITSLTTFNTLNLLKRSDKVEVSSWAMPSWSYTDLTLGASGSIYTAPSNGWVYFSKTSTGADQFMTLGNGKFQTTAYSTRENEWIQLFIPVRRNDSIYVGYDLGGSTNFFRFYYAVGSESEAS